MPCLGLPKWPLKAEGISALGLPPDRTQRTECSQATPPPGSWQGEACQQFPLDTPIRVGRGRGLRVILCPRRGSRSLAGPALRYLSVSWRLLPRDKEIERKKPWTAGTVYIKRVLDKSCWNTHSCLSVPIRKRGLAASQQYLPQGVVTKLNQLMHEEPLD